MNTNLARKYRPKVLSDLIGQPSVTRIFTNAITHNRLQQCYVLYGIIGSGKSTMARLLAAMENCTVSPGVNPCGKCDNCKRIFEGKHTDVVEIDAASGAGKVEQIRKLKTDALYNPIDGCKTKYFIIDECLPYGTLISMANGNEITIGELVEEFFSDIPNEHGQVVVDTKESFTVKSQDMQTGELIEQKICRYIKISNDKQMYEIKIKDEQRKIHILRITGNHNVFVCNEEQEKVKAKDLKVGQNLFFEGEIGSWGYRSESQECEIISIKKIECKDKFVYNLEVESSNSRNKNYFANGILVSNCHRMTPASNDALLKILEEPPSNVRFVLSTTDIQKMRPALISRCQRHDFKKIYWTQIAERIKEVSKLEKIQVSDGAVNICAKLAQGSMRNGLQNLQKLVDLAGTGESCVIDDKMAEEIFGAASEMLFYDLFDQIIGDETSKPDASEGYAIIYKMLQNGMEFESIYQSLSEYLRNLLVVLTAQKAYEYISVSSVGKERLKTQAMKCQKRGKISAVISAQQFLSKSYERYNSNIAVDDVLQTWFIQSVMCFKEKIAEKK